MPPRRGTFPIAGRFADKGTRQARRGRRPKAGRLTHTGTHIRHAFQRPLCGSEKAPPSSWVVAATGASSGFRDRPSPGRRKDSPRNEYARTADALAARGVVRRTFYKVRQGTRPCLQRVQVAPHRRVGVYDLVRRWQLLRRRRGPAIATRSRRPVLPYAAIYPHERVRQGTGRSCGVGDVEPVIGTGYQQRLDAFDVHRPHSSPGRAR